MNKKPKLPGMVRKQWFISAKRCRAMIALLSLFLLPLLTGCGSSRIEYVQRPHIPISHDLTAVTPVPAVPESLTYGVSLDLNTRLYLALGQCNADKAAIRKIETERAVEM